MNYIKVSFGIFLALAASRFIPHPPNFTSLLALSFYVPALLGIRYLPALIVSFIVTDLFLGFHETALFTWGSVLLIGFLSKYFITNITSRITGAIIGACIFFLVTNFGVWSIGIYGYTLSGILTCYTLALPFFAYSLLSTLIFSCIIETPYKLLNKKIKYN
tara:strand:- start:209 stop:691 length:483 start_codon:yes stop_codon:yes gene_type:complete